MAKKKGNQKNKSKNDVKDLIKATNELDPKLTDLTKFSDLPLSNATQQGLKQSHFVKMTDIQKQTIIPALQGRDILGAARTGSGKTLAFVVPLLELLYRENWNPQDGLGALVISPTRELAVQTFEVLKKVGRNHGFSAGLVIGGKDLKVEMERIGRLNILIGTPGRLLQHFDEAPDLDTNGIKVLVLDEADRMLDMGFKRTMDGIIGHLPMPGVNGRKTWLFSATQTKSVSDLARLSLKNPLYVSVDEESVTSTPKQLKQYYIVTPLPEKLSTLFNFIKTHLKTKMLVFLSSSKQVRYVYETFRTLQPGISLLHLHGKQKQTARLDSISKFSSAKHACLLATDVVARGIDFPTIDWVLQIDAPDSPSTYIHRVGRTARFGKAGQALLIVTPEEEPIVVPGLEGRRIPIQKLTVRATQKTRSVSPQLTHLCFKNPELKYLGQKAFMSYVKSIHIQSINAFTSIKDGAETKDKSFNSEKWPWEEFAKSMGLPGAPKVKFGSLSKSKDIKNLPRKLLSLAKANDDGEIVGEVEDKDKPVRTKYDKMFSRQNQNVLSEHYMKLTGADNQEEEDDFITLKRADHTLVGSEDESEGDNTLPTSNRAAKRATSKKGVLKARGLGTKLIFDDEGNPHAIYELESLESFNKSGPAEEQKVEFISKEREVMTERDVEDKAVAKEKKDEKKRKRKEAERAANDMSESEDGGYQVYIGGQEGEEADDDEEEEFGGFSSDNEDNQKPQSKKSKNSKTVSDDDLDGFEVPNSLEDLEALSSRLLKK